ncbi:carboxypeptidase [Achlya hypogyna]|uniref:Carboxypeptidase n=1 Tax=Achlya hypogyna TaxID=1202772 RepID=A0A0A7CNW9_ACHHY|nr:secreted protein [Achlya hypogyna]OQR86656.1 carboxypeptidase [Achlya hypogyna]
MKFATFLFCLASASAALFEQLPDGRTRSQEELKAIADDADVNRKCHTQNANYIPALVPGKYVESAFHNCFRTAAQIDELFNAFAARHPSVVTKEAVATTTKGQTIFSYTLRNGPPKKQAIYVQSLIHAREWIAGSSNFYTVSKILDDITTNVTGGITDAYDVIVVPIFNRDGFDLTWTGKRYQRKNANQVDLNRNFPGPFDNPNPPSPSADDYPGPNPLSEAESKSLHAWLLGKPKGYIKAFIDVHSYAGYVLLPVGDTEDALPGNTDTKLRGLGQRVGKALGGYTAGRPYELLYKAYHTFQDYGYRQFLAPSITIEVKGNDFVAPVSSIRTRGIEIYNGLTQFAKEVTTYYKTRD